MKTIMILLSTLVLGLGVAFAQDQADGRFLERPGENDLRASELMGATVYVTDTEVAATTVDAVPEEWENVANIDDFVLSPDGTIRGVLVDVGGFLGIGARQVMVNMDALNFVRQQDADGVYVVFMSTREELEQAPEYRHEVMTDEAAAEEEPRADEPMADDERRLGVPDEPLEGFQPVEVGTLTVDELTNAAVYDRFNERVSGIRDVQLSGDGTEVVGVLIDVGGFLGLGARTVAVDMDQLEIQVDPERNDVRVYLNMTREELENLPEHE